MISSFLGLIQPPSPLNRLFPGSIQLNFINYIVTEGISVLFILHCVALNQTFPSRALS